MNKICKKCKIEKPLEEYHNKAMGKHGKDSKCKICRSEDSNLKYLANADKIKAQTNAYKAAHREEIRARSKIYDQEHAEAIALRKAAYNQLDYVKAKARERNKKNRAHYNEYEKNKRATDLQFRLKAILRTRIGNFIRKIGGTKRGSAVKDLGCTIPKFIKYIESKFQPGMSWDNYGLDTWHIDHIIPLAQFDLTNKSQFLKACRYTNLQPLWASENWKKNRHIK